MNYSKPPSFLIVKASAIGDVIQTFPALEYLRKQFPEARIDWVVEQGIAPLLRAHPQIDHVLEIHTRKWRKAPLSSETRSELNAGAKQIRSTTYDVLFDLQGNAKSSVVTALAKADVKVGFGWGSVREKCNLLVLDEKFTLPSDLSVRNKYLGLVQSYFKDASPFEAEGIRLKISEAEQQRLGEICSDPALSRKTKLMVCFGSKWANKRLETATLASLLQKIADDEDASFVFIYGDEEEKRIAEQLLSPFKDRAVAVGSLSLPLWQALMWEMDGVIAVDSAALHLCGTTRTPSFSVFGPSMSTSYKPSEERHSSVQGSCPYGRTFSTHCPILRTCATGACIRQLQASDLFASYKQWSQSFLKQTTITPLN